MNFRIKEASELLKTLQIVHIRLNMGVNLRLIFSAWVPFLAIYLIPLLFKVYDVVFWFESWYGLLLEVSAAARFNYLNASLLTFVVTCYMMGTYYMEILKQLEAEQLYININLENLKYCHLKLFESVERVKKLYGIHILFGLVTSNTCFQMTVVESLQQWINSSEYWTMPSIFLSTFLFMSLDIGRIVLCFTSSNIICKQVKAQNNVLIFCLNLVCIPESRA